MKPLVKDELIKIFKLICDECSIRKVNNIDFLFVADHQKFILTESQKEILENFMSSSYKEIFLG